MLLQRQRQLQLGRVDRDVPRQPQAEPVRSLQKQHAAGLAEVRKKKENNINGVRQTYEGRSRF